MAIAKPELAAWRQLTLIDLFALVTSVAVGCVMVSLFLPHQAVDRMIITAVGVVHGGALAAAPILLRQRLLGRRSPWTAGEWMWALACGNTAAIALIGAFVTAVFPESAPAAIRGGMVVIWLIAYAYVICGPIVFTSSSFTLVASPQALSHGWSDWFGSLISMLYGLVYLLLNFV